MKTRLKVSGGSEPLKKAIGAAKGQSRHQKVSNFSACNAQLTKQEKQQDDSKVETFCGGLMCHEERRG